jgi:hypothetical protein
MITIIVSMAIQRVNTREKLVRKFNEKLNESKTIKVIKNAKGNNIDAINDSLNHTKSKIVINTNINV